MELNSSFANTDKTILAGTPMSITNDHQSFSSESSNSDIQKKKTCQVFCRHLKTVLLFFLVIVVTGLAIVLIVGSTKLNNKIEILEIKITSLEAKLNNSIFTSSARINNPENPATTPEFQQLQQLIEQLQDSIATINGSIRNTETEKRISVIAASVNRSILELEENLEEISDSLVDVNSTLRQTFAGCYEDRETCTLFPAQTDMYYRGCTTNELSSNTRVSFKVEMHIKQHYSGFQLHSIFLFFVDGVP